MANSRAGRSTPLARVHVALRNLRHAPLAHLEANRASWFLWTPVCFGLGIVVYFSMPREPTLGASIVPSLLALAVLRLLAQHFAGQLAASAAVLVALGFTAAKLREVVVAAPVLEQRTLRSQVTGLVVRVEPRTELGPRVTVHVLAIKGLAQERTPARIRVRMLRRNIVIRPGDALRFDATLSPPPAPVLRGGYDFARTTYFSRIGAVGYVRGRPQRIEASSPIPLRLRLTGSLQRLRQWLGERITARLPGQTGAIANALMTGERGQIARATLDAYRDSGLLHILSISGLHMAIMGGSVFFALRLLFAAVPALALRYPIKKWAAAGAVLGAMAYLMVSGTTHATIRAFVMIAIMMVAIVLDRPAIALRNVAIAALFILVVTPESVLHAGFQMSFAAVVALVAAYQAVRDHRHGRDDAGARSLTGVVVWFVVGVVGSTIIASLAVAPFAAFHFHKSQQYAVLANLIAVPVCNFIVLPAALVAYLAMPFGLDWAPLWVMGHGIDLMTWTAAHVAGLPGAVSHIPAISSAGFGLIVGGGLWLCLWRTRWRLWGLLAIALGIAIAPLRERPHALIGRNGDLVAVRQPDGRLAALAGPGTDYELSRWREHDGAGAGLRPAAARRVFRCDQVGCVVNLAGRRMAISSRPASLIDDCRRADVLVLSYPQPPGCRARGLVIDGPALRRHGTHAVYRTGAGHLVVRTVAGERGSRPWTRRPLRTNRQSWRQ